MNKEQAREFVLKYKWVPTPGSTYISTPLADWMIEMVQDAYELGYRNGRMVVEDWNTCI